MGRGGGGEIYRFSLVKKLSEYVFFFDFYREKIHFEKMNKNQTTKSKDVRHGIDLHHLEQFCGLSLASEYNLSTRLLFFQLSRASAAEVLPQEREHSLHKISSSLETRNEY